MRSRTLAFMIALSFGAAGRAQQAVVPMDFATAQQRLLDTSDAVEAAQANVRGKEEQEGATRTLHRPEVNVEAQLLDYQKSLYVSAGSLAPVAAQFGLGDELRLRLERTNVRPLVSATVPLYSGGQIPAVQSGASAQVAQAVAERDIAVNRGVLQLVQAYWGQVLAERALAVRRDLLAGLDGHLAAAVRLEQAGMATRAQRLQAQVARDDAARELETAMATLASANATLAGLLRAPGGVRPVTPLFVIATPLEPLSGFTAAALSGHPQLARLGALERQASAGVDVQRAALRPQVFGFGQYSLDRRNALLTDPDWAVGVGLRYRLLSGTGRRQAVAAARQAQAQAEAGMREARTELEIGVARAWHEAGSARARFVLLQSAIASTDENLRLQTLAFREQQATALDVIDAQLGVGRARIQMAQAAYDFDMALARLLDACGQITRMPDYVARADRTIP